MEELKLRVRELENELIKCKHKQSAMEDAHKLALNRPKIDKMSAEVVDSNPYRWMFIYWFLVQLFWLFMDILRSGQSAERRRLVIRF